LKDRGGKDDKMSGRVWKAVETKIGEVRMVEAKGREGQRGSRKKTGGAGKEKAKGKEDSGDKE